MLVKFINTAKVDYTRARVHEGLTTRPATDEELIEMGYKELTEVAEPTDGRNWECEYTDGDTITMEWKLSAEQPSVEKIRERNYELCKCIEWSGKLITVDQANRLVTQYECEGLNMDELKSLIHQRKQEVRSMFS